MIGRGSPNPRPKPYARQRVAGDLEKRINKLEDKVKEISKNFEPGTCRVCGGGNYEHTCFCTFF